MKAAEAEDLPITCGFGCLPSSANCLFGHAAGAAIPVGGKAMAQRTIFQVRQKIDLRNAIASGARGAVSALKVITANSFRVIENPQEFKAELKSVNAPPGRKVG